MTVVAITFVVSWFLERRKLLALVESSPGLDDEGLLKALTGAYMPMSYTWNTGYANIHTVGVLMGSDDLTTASYTARAEYREFDRYNVNDWNNGLRFIWNGAYKSIQGAYCIIANYHNVSGNLVAIEQITGEAYFLRAYNYFWIVRLWGDAPLIL